MAEGDPVSDQDLMIPLKVALIRRRGMLTRRKSDDLIAEAGHTSQRASIFPRHHRFSHGIVRVLHR